MSESSPGSTPEGESRRERRPERPATGGSRRRSRGPSGAGRNLTDRAVSPVVGTVLLVAIVVTLGGVTAVMTLGVSDGLAGPPPMAEFDASYDPSGSGNDGKAYVNVSHEAGQGADGGQVYVLDSDGNEVAWEAFWTAGEAVGIGEYAHVDGAGSDCALNPITEGEVYRVVWRDDGRSGHVLETVEIDTPPETSPTLGSSTWTC